MLGLRGLEAGETPGVAMGHRGSSRLREGPAQAPDPGGTEFRARGRALHSQANKHAACRLLWPVICGFQFL